MKTTRELQNRIFDRINPAVRFSVSRYVLAIGLFVAMLIFGGIATLSLGVDQFPSSSIPVAVVNTSYPGASPSVIDEQVTQVIESAVSTMGGITDISSTSSSGSSMVMIDFDQSTDQVSDASQVASLVSAAAGRLPSGAGTPSVLTMNPNATPILQFGIAGPGVSLAEVNDYTTTMLEPKLQRVSGVANVSLSGAPSREFQVLLDPSRLQAYGLGATAVVNAIASSSVTSPIGTITTSKNALTFSTENVPSDKEAVESIVVDTTSGVRVRDLANVRDRATSSTYTRINGKPVVLVSIEQTATSNAVAVVSDVRRILSQVVLPTGYEIIYSNDTTAPIQASIHSTYRELILTTIVVALIVLLFLGKLNTAVSVILAIPIALSASPVLYRLCGFTLNLVSMLALIVAIGIVVDDSIVVAENVERYRAMGYHPRESVLKGASEIFSAVVAATLSILAVLLPVSFLGGMIGSFLRQFCLGLAAAVLFSLLEAVLFLTVRLAYLTDVGRRRDWGELRRSFTRPGEAARWGLVAWRRPVGIVVAVGLAAACLLTHHLLLLPCLLLYPAALMLLRYLGLVLLCLFEALSMTLHGWTEAGLGWVREAYARSLGGLLRRGVVVLLVTLTVVAGILVFLAPRLTFSFLPQTDNGTLSLNGSMRRGATLSVTNAAAASLERYLLSQPEVRVVQTTVGGGGMFGGGSSYENFSMRVTLVDVGKRAGTFTLIARYRIRLNQILQAQDPSASVMMMAGGGFGGGGSALSLALLSSDREALSARSARVVEAIKSNPYVQDVTSSVSETTVERQFIPDPVRLQDAGVTAGDVATLLQTYATGVTAANVEVGGLSYPITVRIDPLFLSDGQALLNLPLYSPKLQATVPVGQLGSVVLRESPVSIRRTNRLYSASLSINLKQGAPTALSFQNQLAQDLTAQGLLDTTLTLGSGSLMGAGALAQQMSSTAIWAFLLAFFLAYLVMAAQFNSWRYPVYLLLPVPLAIVGALAFAIVLGGGLDIFGVLGMLLLIGLSAKNAILYLDFVVERLDKMPLLEALVDSARLRFRPIIMTTLTVLVISGPLVFAQGQGSEFGQKLGVVMFGGILSSAILTFFVVPTAFYVFERKRTRPVQASDLPDRTETRQEDRAPAPVPWAPGSKAT
ncbi:MAG TPA: efflux RND transporter permease subunit [Spirochaetia bacterium]|nr:efflux RND transporter permease subunit [Spirochaetia bacterium]